MRAVCAKRVASWCIVRDVKCCIGWLAVACLVACDDEPQPPINPATQHVAVAHDDAGPTGDTFELVPPPSCRRISRSAPMDVSSNAESATAKTTVYECQGLSAAEAATMVQTQFRAAGFETVVQRVDGYPLPGGAKGQALHVQAFVSDKVTISVDVPIDVSPVTLSVMRLVLK